MAKKKEDHQKKKIEELDNQLKRTLADFVNFQKRTQEEKLSSIQYGKAEILNKFLPVLDNLISIKEASRNDDNLAQALDIAIKQIKKIFEEEGVKEIDTSGSFDPSTHEAVEVIPGEEDNKVAEVVQVGYSLNGQILRPALVKVSKKENK